MSKNLELIINEAVNHNEEQLRSVNIIVPKNLKSQAYSIFIKRTGHIKWAFNDNGEKLKLSVAQISAESDIHYDTVYLINPQDIEDQVLKEIKMIPDADGLLICAKV